ncbi:Uncharacterised protein [Acinetobacter baumannii]|nr:Uncharacterised protein [Acinetobacter baumannii]
MLLHNSSSSLQYRLEFQNLSSKKVLSTFYLCVLPHLILQVQNGDSKFHNFPNLDLGNNHSLQLKKSISDYGYYFQFGLPQSKNLQIIEFYHLTHNLNPDNHFDCGFEFGQSNRLVVPNHWHNCPPLLVQYY